jgi:hypothetical protein
LFLLPLKILKKIIFFLVPAVLIYYVITLGQCVAASGTSNATSADAVVVLAPANLTGTNDPNAVALADQALSSAPLASNQVIVAGGTLINTQSSAEIVSQDMSSQFNTSSRQFPHVVLAGGTNLWSEIQQVSTYASSHNIKTVVVVVNPSLQLIAAGMLSSNGLTPEFNPPNVSESSSGSFVGTYLSEALEVSIARITGYSIADSMFKI